jgi:hypothetical protein
VVEDLQQTYSDFGSERALYPAAARIEASLSQALTYAGLAGSYASQSQLAEAKSNLRRAIDYLELANVLMLYGDVSNPADYPQFLVRQHYVDFLGREPDESGRAFWTEKIAACGANAGCAEAMRIEVSAAYYLSIEFKETGYLVYRLHSASYGRRVQYAEFISDTQEIERGLIVGQPGWQDVLSANKTAFLSAWVQRPEFRARYDGLRPDQFVDALYATAGVAPDPAERDALVAFASSGAPREQVLLRLADSEQFTRREYNPAFVTMEYFGYLRRDPDDAGFQYWLKKLDDSGGDYRRAEMVKAFLNSVEYRQRFENWQ